MILPNFVIIGAQKSGSTFFLKCLAEHPDVFMPQAEVRFFEDPDSGNGDPRPLEALFSGVNHETAIGIKRPAYLARPEVAARIHRHIPNAKLVAILREPVGRAISAYFHLMHTGFIPVRPLNEGMTRILDGDYKETHPKAAEILDFGYYHRHLARYLEFFDRGQMLILLFDAIAADPLASIRQAYRFVGVGDDHVPVSLTGSEQRNAGVYSLARLRLLNLRNPFLYTYDSSGTGRRARRRPSLVGRGVRRLVDTADRRILTRAYGAARPDPGPDLRRRLHLAYADDIDRLEELLGQSLDSWRPFQATSART